MSSKKSQDVFEDETDEDDLMILPVLRIWRRRRRKRRRRRRRRRKRKKRRSRKCTTHRTRETYFGTSQRTRTQNDSSHEFASNVKIILLMFLYVVFERGVRECHFFTFLSYHSNHKNITRIPQEIHSKINARMCT